MTHPISNVDAQSLIAMHCHRLPDHRIAVAQSLGRIVAATVTSPAYLPPFDNAAMDGFALRHADLPSDAGTALPVCGEQPAGAGPAAASVGVWEIMTGARMPDGTDTVVPVEQSEIVERDATGRTTRVKLHPPIRPGQNVRQLGEDVALGQVLMPCGTLIGPAQRMLLHGAGMSHVMVAPRPGVAVICTGRELVDDPFRPLQAGEIRNTSGAYLHARLNEIGAHVIHRETVGDEPAAFLGAVARARQAGAQMIVSTGAVSMGRYDFIPDALASIGARIVFHKVRVRPGKPVLFAQLSDGTYFFGLPGNPASTATGLRFFVEPALRRLMGLAHERPWHLPLLNCVRKRAGLRQYLKASVRVDATGQLGVYVLPGQESFRIAPMAHANAWAVLEERDEMLEPGARVAVYGVCADRIAIEQPGGPYAG